MSFWRCLLALTLRLPEEKSLWGEIVLIPFFGYNTACCDMNK
ncbi:hypothetical protein BN439_1864 [Erwinia amylovora Ea644]|nr:hypothetical protein BN439_1864 [Erwinia amylovora Ea644]CCP06957.1 hypothetical protein BN440_1931 [Erwinia amylovora MR1]